MAETSFCLGNRASMCLTRSSSAVADDDDANVGLAHHWTSNISTDPPLRQIQLYITCECCGEHCLPDEFAARFAILLWLGPIATIGHDRTKKDLTAATGFIPVIAHLLLSLLIL